MRSKKADKNRLVSSSHPKNPFILAVIGRGIVKRTHFYWVFSQGILKNVQKTLAK
jgi:hypothetical protein